MAKVVLRESPHVLPPDLDLLFERGEGHPLATIYLLGELRDASSKANVDEIFSEARSFGSDVEVRYQSYWQAISDDATKHLLALLARIRIPIDFLDSLSWIPNLNAHDFIFNTKHYFQELDQHRWTFFHNSFRQFLLRKTSENALGRFDAAIDKRHHAVLARMCATSTSSTMRREALFHNFMAGEFRAVIVLGTQRYFRSQFVELRHPHQIFDDISLVLRAASHELDGLAVVRAWLVELELREREQALGTASFRVSLDTFIGDEDLIDAISDTGHLFVDRAEALRASARLLENGRVVQAKALFELAEPLDVLAGITKSPRWHEGDGDNLLFNWLAVATRFREVADILTAISRVKADTIQLHEESWTQELRHSLLTSVGATCLSRGSEAWDAFKAHPIVVEFGSTLLEDIDWRAAATGSPEMRSQALDRVLARTNTSDLDPHTRTYLADLMRRNGYDAVAIESLLEGVVQPPLADIHDSSSYLRLSAFSHRILLNRLLAFLGRPQSPEQAVPWPSDARLQVLARLERALVSVANLWGSGFRGDVFTGPEIVLQLHHALRFYYQDRSDVHIGWYRYSALAREFFETIVRATEPHGPAGLDALGEEFDRLWVDGDIRGYWPTDLRVAIAVNLVRYGGAAQLLAQRIDRADDRGDAERDLEERLQVLLDLARAWRMVGNDEQTSNCLKRMLQGSFGIYHDKDRQIQAWVDWLDRAARNGGTTLASELPKFAAALGRIVETRRGRGAQEAGQHLVAACFRESPSLAGELVDRLLGQGTIEYAFAASGMVSGLLQRSDATFSTTLCYLVHIGVALSLPDTESLARRLVTTASTRQIDDVPGELTPLINAIRTHEFANSRQAWFSGLVDGLRRAAIFPSGLELLIEETPPIHHDSSSTTQLRDGSTVQAAEIVKGIQDFSSLIEAIRRVVPDSGISWERIARPYIETADERQLNALRGVLAGPGSAHARLSIALIDRYIALSDLDTARKLASDLFAAAPAIGWIEWFDGGTKIKPALQLIGIDASGSRAVIFRSMISDYLTELRNSRDFVSALDDLVAVLFQTIPWRELWTEIYEHVSQLSEFEGETLRFDTAGELSADQALLKSVVQLFALTIPELEQRCAECLASLANGTQSMRAAVIAALSESSLPHWKIALVLFLCGGGRGSEPLLAKFANDSDLSVRVIARKLTDGLADRDALRQPGDWATAPVALRLGLPSSESDEPSIPLNAITSGQPLPKPRTPLDLFHIWLPEVNALANEARIPVENLLERAWQLAKKCEQQFGIADDADRELRNYLSAIELQMTYRRPWSDIAALALQALWAELVDYGRVAPETILRYGVHRVFDEVLIKKGAQPRPDKWVAAMASGTTGPPDNWLTSTDEALGNLAFHRAAPDGLVVVAEFSRFVAHDWERSTETRTAFLTAPSVTGTRVQLTSDNDWFPNVGHHGTESYRSRSAPNGEMFVGGNAYRLRCGPTKWLAIAPEVATRLHLSPSGQPLSWIDSNGLPSAWSVYWTDGPGRRQPPNFDHVYGSGWLVVVRRDNLTAAGVRNFRLHAWCTRHSHGTHGRQDEQRSSRAETAVAV